MSSDASDHANTIRLSDAIAGLGAILDAAAIACGFDEEFQEYVDLATVDSDKASPGTPPTSVKPRRPTNIRRADDAEAPTILRSADVNCNGGNDSKDLGSSAARPPLPTSSVESPTAGRQTWSHSGSSLDTFNIRLMQSAIEKIAIGAYIAGLMRSSFRSATVGLDGGTTNLAIAEAIGRDARDSEAATVGSIVTNNLEVPPAIPLVPTSPEMFVTGGTMRRDRRTLIGRAAISSIKEYRFAVVMIGINGIVFPELYTATETEWEVKLAFMKQAQTVIVPFDPCKWHNVYGRKLIDLRELVLRLGKTVRLVTSYPRNDLKCETLSGGGATACLNRLDETAEILRANWQQEFHVDLVAYDVSDAKSPRLIGKDYFDRDSFSVKSVDEFRMEQHLRDRDDVCVVLSIELSSASQDDPQLTNDDSRAERGWTENGPLSYPIEN